jgi:hypothetical protein
LKKFQEIIDENEHNKESESEKIITELKGKKPIRSRFDTEQK